MAALERTLEQDPNHALAAAHLADLLVSTYHLGFTDDSTVLDRAEELALRAVALDASCQHARYAMALVHFLRLRPDLVREELERALQLNPNYANILGAAALLLSMVGEWDRAMELINRAMRLNPHYPGWYHFVSFMNCYRQGSYDVALNEARRFNTPNLLWDPLIRAAALGRLGRQAEANAAVNVILALRPDFQERAQDLMRRVVFLDEHVEMLLNGLQEAGLDVSR
jgi:tetratricopeptide (TPR) repeat protein